MVLNDGRTGGRGGRPRERPTLIGALAVFFALGALISGVAGVSLLVPGSALEPMWRLNPRARHGFAVMGPAAALLMGTVCVTCALAAVGLWWGRRWGYRVAVGLLVVQLAGDLANVLLGLEPRAIVGVPVVVVLLVVLARPGTRRYFEPPGGTS
jgi:hypothetical protein